MKPILQRTVRLLSLACFVLAVSLPHAAAAREPLQSQIPQSVLIWNSSNTPVQFLLQSGGGAWATYVLEPGRSATYRTDGALPLGFRMSTSRSGGRTQEVQYQLERTKRYKLYYNAAKAQFDLVEMRPR